MKTVKLWMILVFVGYMVGTCWLWGSWVDNEHVIWINDDDKFLLQEKENYND